MSENLPLASDDWGAFIDALPYPACIIEAGTFIVNTINADAAEYWEKGQPCSGASFCRRIVDPDHPVTCPANKVVETGRNIVIDHPVPLHAYPLFLDGDEVSHILFIVLDAGSRLDPFTLQPTNEARGAFPPMGILEPFFDAMAMGLTITNREGKILFTNTAEAIMHGYETRDLIGQHTRVFAPEKMWKKIPMEELVHRGIWDHVTVNLTRGGRRFPVRLISMPLIDNRGNPLGIITLSQDLTHTQRVEEALEEVRREAAMGRMAAMVAHQVNNPLAAMKTRIALLRQDIGDVESAQETIAILCKQVDRIAGTMRALLNFAGDHRTKPNEIVAIDTTVKDVLQLFHDVLDHEGIAVNVDVPPNLSPIRGKIDDIREIFINLLENGRQALTAGSHIMIRGRKKGEWIEIIVEDDGPGLGEDPEKVFESFYTTKASGTGLGLTITRQICKDYGGYMMAENRSPQEGGGARFTLSLPVAEEKAHA